MATSTSIKDNAVSAVAVFVDSAGAPLNPDGAVTWTVYDQSQAVLVTATQALAAATAAGTFKYAYVPLAVETLYFEAKAVVEGVQQCERIAHVVTWT